MTDRELLELAAKAAGKTNWQSSSRFADAKCDSEGVPYWNPLIDDGDALRLAMKLDLIFPVDNKWQSYMRWCFNEEIKADVRPSEATRRAIVRAAAEIGKEMK